MFIHPPSTESSNLPAASRAQVQPQVVVMAPANRQTVWWVMAVLLAVIATALVLRLDEALLAKSALAQTTGTGKFSPDKQYIYAFTGQLTSKSYGLFMLDMDTSTLWCYEMQKSRDDQLRMKLVAARSWLFDRYLEEFNVLDPKPGAVRLMVEQQRSQGEVPDQAPGKTSHAPLFPEGGK